MKSRATRKVWILNCRNPETHVKHNQNSLCLPTAHQPQLSAAEEDSVSRCFSRLRTRQAPPPAEPGCSLSPSIKLQGLGAKKAAWRCDSPRKSAPFASRCGRQGQKSSLQGMLNKHPTARAQTPEQPTQQGAPSGFASLQVLFSSDVN